MAPSAFPMSTLGTIMVSIGMFLCAFIIQSSTKKEHYEQSKKRGKMYWCQTDGQKLGDQVFNAFIGSCEDDKYVQSRKIDRHARFWEGKGQWLSDDVLLWAAVSVTMAGFVVQFVGLRAMHSSISVAQLGSTVIMAVIRAGLRTQRMDGSTNLLSKVKRRKFIKGHELDQLAMVLEGVRSVEVAACHPHKDTLGFSLEGSANTLEKKQEMDVVSKRQSSLGGKGSGDLSGKYSKPNSIARVVKARARLARLTGQGPGLQIPWDFEVRTKAHQLQAAIEGTMDNIFTTGTALDEDWEDASDFYWVIRTRCIFERSCKDTTVKDNDKKFCCKDEKFYLSLSRKWIPGKGRWSSWKANHSEIEAILGLWSWSTLSSDDPLGIVNSRIVAHDTDVDLGEVCAEYSLWAQGMGYYERYMPIFHTVGDWPGHPPSRFFGLQQLPFLPRRGTQENLYRGHLEDRMGDGGLAAISYLNSLTTNNSGMSGNTSMLGKVLAVSTENSLLAMCTQDIFVSFLASVLNIVDKTNGETSIRGGDHKDSDFQLFNTQVETLVDIFERSKLGSREDAHLCVVPTLKREFKLPTIDVAIPSARERANDCKINGRWSEGERLLRWIRHHCSLQNRTLLETHLGEYYATAVRDSKPEVRKLGIDGIISMLSANNRNGLVNELADIAQRFGWIALRILGEEKNPGDSDTKKLLEKAGATPNFVTWYNGKQDLTDCAADSSTSDTVRRDCLTVARYLLEREGTDVNGGGNGTPLFWAAKTGHADMVQLLLDHGADMKIGRGVGSILREAVVNGHEAAARLLAGGCDITARDRWGATLLHFATRGGSEGIIRLLVDSGLGIEEKDDKGETALHWAACIGSEAMVRILLELGADIEARHNHGWTVMHSAAASGHTDVLKLLREKGAQVCGDDLLWAAREGHVAVVQTLLDWGIDINTRDSTGDTPICIAALEKHESVVRFLVQKGADVGAKNDHGGTALMNAAYNGTETIVQVLLESGASVVEKGESGYTALHRAASWGHTGSVQLLLEFGSEVNARTQNGDTPLQRAAAHGSKATAQLLVDKGADIEAKDDNGKTPLIDAARRGSRAAVEFLLENRASVNTTDEDGQSALRHAISNAHVEVVRLILEKGTEVDVETRDKSGRTALQSALFEGHSTIIELLLEHGAQQS